MLEVVVRPNLSILATSNFGTRTPPKARDELAENSIRNFAFYESALLRKLDIGPWPSWTGSRENFTHWRYISNTLRLRVFMGINIVQDRRAGTLSLPAVQRSEKQCIPLIFPRIILHTPLHLGHAHYMYVSSLNVTRRMYVHCYLASAVFLWQGQGEYSWMG
jgi:hypothetical protein